MNKKAQAGPIAAIMLFAVFLVMLFVWLGGWVGEVGSTTVADNSLTGIEAFFFANYPFVIVMCMLLGMLGWMYFSG